MKRVFACIILAPWVTWMVLVWGFFFMIFMIPQLLFVTMEWLSQAAKGGNQTFCEIWMLDWKDSMAQWALKQMLKPI